MENSEFVVVFTGRAEDARFLASVLRGAGIPSTLRNETTGGLFAYPGVPVFAEVCVMVDRVNAESALEIIAAPNAGSKDDLPEELRDEAVDTENPIDPHRATRNFATVWLFWIAGVLAFVILGVIRECSRF